MKDLFDNQIRGFRGKRGQALNKAGELKDMLDSFQEGPLSDVGDIRNVITNAKNTYDNEMQSIQGSVSDLAGSCLDGVFNQLKKASGNIGNLIREILPDTTMETNLLGNLEQYKKLLESLGIAGLIRKLDELAGCLADSDCIPAGEIDNVYSEINSFIDVTGLTLDGHFDQDTYLDAMDVDEIYKTGLDTFKEDMEGLKTEVNNVTQGTMNKVKPPEVEVDEELF
jgi:hypothetical protein